MGRRVAEAAVLTDLAIGLGLNRDAFQRSFEDLEVDAHIARACGWMARLGLRSFPSSVLKN